MKPVYSKLRPVSQCLTLLVLFMWSLPASRIHANVVPSLLSSWEGGNDFYMTGAPLSVDTNVDGSVDTQLPSTTFSVGTSDVPAGATLINAYLYWGGTQIDGGSADSSVRLTAPGGSPLTLTADVSHASDGGTASFDMFLSRADVTSQITGSLSGTYTVDSYSGLIGNNPSHNSSTALLLIFSVPSAPLRQIMVHDGLLTMLNSTHSISVSGFDVAASPAGTLAYYTLEGDVTVVPGTEEVRVTGLPGGLSSTLSDGLNPSTNPMNQTINTTMPMQLGTIGMDIDRFDITPALTPHDSAVDVFYSTGSDRWWLGVNVMALNVAEPSTALQGDYNENSTVDAADYTAWRDALTAGATSLTNDPTPGIIDESDFDYWRDHFGETLGSGSDARQAAVPEPASLVMLLVAALAMLSRRARHFHQLVNS